MYDFTYNDIMISKSQRRTLMKKALFLAERIYKTTQIPIHYIDPKGEMILFTLGYKKSENPFVSDKNLIKEIQSALSFNDIPILKYEEDFLYGAFKDSLHNVIILGPVIRQAQKEFTLKAYAYRHKITTTPPKIVRKSIYQLSSVLSLFYLSLTDQYVTEAEIFSNVPTEMKTVGKQNNEVQSYILDTTEEQSYPRYNFAYEMNFMKEIREGNIELMRSQIDSSIHEFDESRIGKFAHKSFKHNEYMGCSAITLASRAAIEGGLDSMTAYSMAELYYQHLANCKEIPEIYALIQKATHTYAAAVKQVKETKSKRTYIEECKNYIAQHLHKKFTIDDIAAEIGVNKAHLSRLFSKSEGMGIMQYTQKKRIEASANMLKYSNESISTISNYFCFSTQSHFSQTFKQRIGLTPNKYREKNKMLDFK